jgi:hypothetical protein
VGICCSTLPPPVGTRSLLIRSHSVFAGIDIVIEVIEPGGTRRTCAEDIASEDATNVYGRAAKVARKNALKGCGRHYAHRRKGNQNQSPQSCKII